MAYDAPTVDDFTTRFPEFADTDEELIETALSDAGNQVDDSWREADYALAIMLLAAHYLSGSTAQSDGDGSMPGSIRSEHFGPMSITYGTTSLGGKSAAAAYYSGTEYGRRFLLLQKKNFPAIVVV